MFTDLIVGESRRADIIIETKLKDLETLIIVHVQFLMLEFKKMNWRTFVDTNNPVAAALLSKMGYTKKRKSPSKKKNFCDC
ncbi:hypothetical protein [Neobacillus niacini]|uniref:hypothetical protein n=1 Tax=Neobacillus niacini TaxID=86668 RepID=UPI002FFED133